jgi:hypothetical protein
MYPFSARLRLNDQTIRATYQHPRDSLGSLPLTPSSSTRLGGQAARAYATLLGRLFRPVGDGVADLELELSIEDSGIGFDSDGWFVAVVHLAVLKDASGSELGRWRAEGRGRIVGQLVGSIPRAFNAAADAAADQLGLLLRVEATEPWSRWLIAHGFGDVAQPGAVEGLRRRLEATRHVPLQPRAARVIFVEAGPSLVLAGRAQSVATALRVGWGNEWLVAAAALQRWPTAFTASPASAWGKSPADLSVTDVGMELAWSWRVARDAELWFGAAAHLLLGQGQTTYAPLDAPYTPRTLHFSASRVAGSLIAGGRIVPRMSFLGSRLRLGLDLRHYLGATLQIPEAGRNLTVAEWSLVVSAGLEWPTSRPSSSDR